MFEDLNKPSGVEDIFSDTEVSPTPHMTPPRPSSSAIPNPVKPTFVPPPAPAGRGPAVLEHKTHMGSKGLIVGVIIVTVIAGLAAAYWFWWRPYYAEQNTLVNDVTNNVNNTPLEITPIENQPAPSAAQDTDGDRLNDQEEFTIGTDPNNPDTDNDGLFDGEEILIYNTNPLNGDTDGDTFIDGEEVRNNYDPNGPGRLLNLPNGELNFQELDTLLESIDNETV